MNEGESCSALSSSAPASHQQWARGDIITLTYPGTAFLWFQPKLLEPSGGAQWCCPAHGPVFDGYNPSTRNLPSLPPPNNPLSSFWSNRSHNKLNSPLYVEVLAFFFPHHLKSCKGDWPSSIEVTYANKVGGNPSRRNFYSLACGLPRSIWLAIVGEMAQQAHKYQFISWALNLWPIPVCPQHLICRGVS